MRIRRLKLAFAATGIVLAVLAVSLDNRLLNWVAIAVLAIALAMRVIERRGGDPPPASP